VRGVTRRRDGDRLVGAEAPDTQPIETRGLTFAIWGPFER